MFSNLIMTNIFANRNFLSNDISLESESQLIEKNITHESDNFCKLILYIEISNSR